MIADPIHGHSFRMLVRLDARDSASGPYGAIVAISERPTTALSSRRRAPQGAATASGVDAGSRRYYVGSQDRLIGSCSARSALLVRGHKRIPTVIATMIQTLLISRTAIPTPTI